VVGIEAGTAAGLLQHSTFARALRGVLAALTCCVLRGQFDAIELEPVAWLVAVGARGHVEAKKRFVVELGERSRAINRKSAQLEKNRGL
jgi:hypothetical protein